MTRGTAMDERGQSSRVSITSHVLETPGEIGGPMSVLLSSSAMRNYLHIDSTRSQVLFYLVHTIEFHPCSEYDRILASLCLLIHPVYQFTIPSGIEVICLCLCTLRDLSTLI